MSLGVTPLVDNFYLGRSGWFYGCLHLDKPSSHPELVLQPIMYGYGYFFIWLGTT